MKKLSKETFIGVITNGIVAILIALVYMTAFLPSKLTESSGGLTTKPYYSGSKEEQKVSLMFNVYENTKCVTKILDILSSKKVKATFFVGGSWADDNEETLIRIVSEGHELGNHGYFHKDHSRLNYEKNKEEVYITEKIVEALCGVKTKLFAPPSGAFNNTTLTVCYDLGYKVIMWSKDTIDWRDKNADTVISRATKNLENGDLVLMHPTEHTASALPKVLDFYKNRGFSEVTVSENISGLS